MLKRMTASFMAIVLAFGLNVPAQALALAPASTGASIATSTDALEAADSTTATTTLDLSDGALQLGGFNQPSTTSTTSALESLIDQQRSAQNQLLPQSLQQAKLQQQSIKAASTDEVKAALKSALDGWATSSQSNVVVITNAAVGMTPDELKALVESFLNAHGEYFFLNRESDAHEIAPVVGNEPFTGNVRITLSTNPAFKKSDVSTFNAKIAEVLAGVKSDWSDEEMLLYLHDYIVSHCQYGTVDKNGKATDSRMYTTYGALIDGVAVCQGYSELFDYLLTCLQSKYPSKIDAKHEVISSKSINHAWNLVTVGGETYFIDCTWDDPVGLWSDVGCCHAQFLLTESEMRASSPSHDASDWLDVSGSPAAGLYGTSTKYSKAYWRDVETVIPQIGRKCAYVFRERTAINSTATIYMHDYSASPNVTGAGDAALAKLPAQWTNEVAAGTSVWKGNYTSLTTDGTSFMASTPTTIHSISSTGADKTIRTLTKAEQAVGQIYGIIYNPAKKDCEFFLRDTPNSASSVTGTSSVVPGPASITSANTTPTVEQTTFTYDENGSAPSLTLKYYNTILTEGTDYQVEYLDSTGRVVTPPFDAGTYTVRVTGLGAFKGTMTAGTFTISQAANSASVKAKVTKKIKAKKLKKKAKTYALDLTADFGEEAAKWKVVKKDKKKVLKLKGNKVQVKKKAKKGTYTIKLQASIPETPNYAAATTKTLTFKVKVK